MPVSRNHGRCAGAFAWVRNQILNLPASALSASMASRALRRAGGAGDGLKSVDKRFPPGRIPPRMTSGDLHLPQPKSAVADFGHFVKWPNPRYSEVRLG